MTSRPSSDKDELQGGQVQNESHSKTTPNHIGDSSPLEPGEKHLKSFRYFSFRKKNMSARSEARQAEKPLRKLSFKSVALTLQKFLIRIYVPKSSEDASSGFQAGKDESSSQESTKQDKDVHSDIVHSKPNWISVFSGIQNHGNTCFLNAIIQCLSHTDLLAEYFVLDSYKDDLRRHKSQRSSDRRSVGHSEVTERLAMLIKSLWTSRYSAEISSGFKSVVGKHGEQYKGTLQHDAQEFLLWLLDAVHEDTNRSEKKKDRVAKSPNVESDKSIDYSGIQSYLANNQSFILDIFQALLRSSLTCPMCGKQSITFDPYLSLSLPIPQRTSCAIRLTYIRPPPHKHHARIAVSIAVKSKVLELLDAVARLMDVTQNSLILTEIYSDGFRRTFTADHMVSDIQNAQNLYVFELAVYNHVEKPTLLMQSLFNKRPNIAILVVNCEVQHGGRRKRFGAPFSLRALKEISYLHLQEAILKAMPNVESDKLDVDVFSLRVCTGGRAAKSSYLTPEVDHPLYQSVVEEALKGSDVSTGPPHVKIIAEWSTEARERYLNFDPNEKLYDMHSSISEVEAQYEEPWMVTIDECLRLYTQEEQLSPEDAWLCPNCKQLQQGAKKQLHLHTVPDVLIIHLKRFKQLKTGRSKLHLMVDFPVEGLDMSPYMDKKKHFRDELPEVAELRSRDHIFDLYAVCNHLGSMSAGHYIAACRNPVDGQWYSYDDSRVARIPEQDIVTKSAYLLFYARRLSGSPTASLSSRSPASPDHWVFKVPRVPLASSEDSLSNVPAESDVRPEVKEKRIERPNLAEFYVSRKFQSETYYTTRQVPCNVMSESCV